MTIDPYAITGISAVTCKKAREIEATLQSQFEHLEALRSKWQLRTIQAFRDVGVSESAYHMASGYGYEDRSRTETEAVFAKLFAAEAAIVRIQFSSGTHVLATMLRGLLAPGDHLIVASGTPYDTILPLLGIGDFVHGSLVEAGVTVDVVPLQSDGTMDFERIQALIRPQTKLVYVQKSRGYSERPAILNEAITTLRETIGPSLTMAVDFCYSEYVEAESPLACGADVIAGSLIKNPGAGIAPTGGYIAGRQDLLTRLEVAMTAPGVGAHIGPQLGMARLIQQGLYFAPRVVSDALKSAVFAAALFADAGFAVSPSPTDARADIVQRIELLTADRLIHFCEAVQHAAPVDSYVTPIPAPMPGYDCDIIMASGSFISGSSIELSADGPLRPPYAAYLQGGLSYENGRLATLLAYEALQNMETN